MSDEADRARIARFLPRLEGELRELAEERERSSQSRDPVELDQQSVGRLSRMDAIQGQQMALAAERRRQVQTERIQRAIRQMTTGEYGYCASCAERIPDARLDADAAAHLCVTCAVAR